MCANTDQSIVDLNWCTAKLIQPFFEMLIQFIDSLTTNCFLILIFGTILIARNRLRIDFAVSGTGISASLFQILGWSCLFYLHQFFEQRLNGTNFADHVAQWSTLHAHSVQKAAAAHNLSDWRLFVVVVVGHLQSWSETCLVLLGSLIVHPFPNYS